MSSRWAVALTWMLLADLTSAAAGFAQGAATDLPAREVLRPVMACAALANREFTLDAHEPISIRSAQVEPATAERAEFCRVRGYIAPQVEFELLLPTAAYTGRYLQGGCGGACGSIEVRFSPQADAALALGGAFAVGFNDSGHVGASGRDTLWAAGDPVLREDYAFRATHVNALAAKAVIAAYYGEPPAQSYFDGCSNGGREGLIEAQRYPQDFGGVIAGAPAVWITPGVVRILWESRVALNADGSDVFTPASTRLLHAAVLEACDALDGTKDGQIDEPRACHFDPRQLVCRAGRAADQCLTLEQAEAARKLYQGPTDEAGHQLYLGGEPYGSELTWSEPGSLAHIGPTLAANQIRYMIFGGDFPADFNWRSWKLNAAAVQLLIDKGGYYDAAAADLAAFAGAGGKLMLWQGAADGAAGPNVLLDYYQRVRDAAGGLKAAQRFARAFIIPGVYHCGGGYVPFDGPMLPALVNWVERGAAPEQLTFRATLADGATRTRPVFAYPLQAHYRGHGDMNAPASFKAAAPVNAPDDHFEWVGAGTASVSSGGAPAAAATGDLHEHYRFAPTGETLAYRLYVPHNYDGKPLPLVVVLHGYRGTADSAFDDAPATLHGILQREAERHDFIVLSPSGYTGTGDYGAHLALKPIPGIAIQHSAREDDLAREDVLAAIADVQVRYRVNAQRVYLMGNSMGMTGTLELAQRFPGRWCAIGPSDGPPWPHYPVERLRALSGAFFVNGGRDQIALTSVNRELAKRVRAIGVDTTFLKVPQGEHGTAWYAALPQMFDFFAAHPCARTARDHP